MKENVEAVRDTVLSSQSERGMTKPTYVCWIVGKEGDENQAVLQDAGIPVYEWPERTARTAAAIANYAESCRTRASHQAPPELPPAGARESAGSIIAAARAQERTILLENEVKSLIATYDARVPRGERYAIAGEGQAADYTLGGAWRRKIVSPDISHKSDVG